MLFQMEQHEKNLRHSLQRLLVDEASEHLHGVHWLELWYHMASALDSGEGERATAVRSDVASHLIVYFPSTPVILCTSCNIDRKRFQTNETVRN